MHYWLDIAQLEISLVLLSSIIIKHSKVVPIHQH